MGAISWTKTWSVSDDGAVLGGANLGDIQSNIDSQAVTLGGVDAMTGRKTLTTSDTTSDIFTVTGNSLTSGSLAVFTTTGTLTDAAVKIIADSATTGDALNISADALTSGSILDLTSTSTSTTARNLVSIANTSAAADSAVCLFINQDANGMAINIDTEADTGSVILQILSAGTSPSAFTVKRVDAVTGNLTLGLGGHFIWVDTTGDLRINGSTPTSDTDGTIVGTQS